MANSQPINPVLLETLLPPPAYRADWPRLAVLLLPALLRRSRQVAWLQVLTAPVARLHGEFVAYLFQKRREQSYNAQVLLFERALNDRFDPLRRRIRILNADTEYTVGYWNSRYEQQPDDEWLRLRSEMPPFPPGLRVWAEYSGQTDFTVVAPTYLQPRAAELRALIRRLKLAMTSYTLLFSNQ